MMEVQVKDSRTSKVLETFKNLSGTTTIGEIKKKFAIERKKFQPSQQSLKTNKNGKSLQDDVAISTLPAEGNRVVVYFKDLGTQIGWSTVFLAEYAGPLVIYLLVHCKSELFYEVTKYNYSWPQKLAMYCWCGHYLKRILETVFIHKFSHETMPLKNLVKNCSYYWGFAAFIAYFHNHHLYTSAIYGDRQLYAGLALFLFSEIGNLSIHVLFKNLRPKGSTVRKIPYPTLNPFTFLFTFVSCPNYTYEVLAWLGYSIMCQSLPGLIFTLAGFGQMTIWALGKHRAYKKEFNNYPKSRKSIIPFVI